MTFKTSLKKLEQEMKHVDQESFTVKPTVTDFRQKKKLYHFNSFLSAARQLIDTDVEHLKKDNLSLMHQLKAQLSAFRDKLNNQDMEGMKKTLAQLIVLENKIIYPTSEGKISFRLPSLPAEIREEMNIDLRELQKCFQTECYRAAVILCGRLLETALHRKYYEVTKNDLLEKSPGIGLGNLVAKLHDKNILLDPAIKQQIHLINQVRIYSVHKKQHTFSPNKDQTHAIILYTLDIIRNLF